MSVPVSILVVEDSEDDIFLLRRAFLEAKFNNTLVFAKNGAEALEFLRRQKSPDENNDFQPNLILMDINMPQMNGFETLEEIKADENLSTIPVVMLTTSSRDDDIRKSYATGASSFITKPVDFASFRQMAADFTEYWTAVAKVPSISPSAA